MAEEWKTPEFLERSFEDVMEEMIADMPEDIDMSEGNHPYNLLAPTAKQEAYFAQYIMAEAMKRIFPKFCEGYSDFVDYHAEVNGMTRKGAARASAVLDITGKADTVIPKGTVFSTISINDVPSVAFASLEEAVIGSDGTAKVAVQAMEAGVQGNVAAGTILLQDSPLDGVSGVVNGEAAAGGTEAESDASLIQRITEYEKMQGLSFVGNDSDYKRWAEEVDGTGVAVVVPPEEDDDSGRVTIILTDHQGNPATEELCRKVYDYIVSPEDRDKRKAPVNGAVISVIPPVLVDLTVSARLTLAEGASLEGVKGAFVKNMAAYLAGAPEDKEIRYTRVAAVLSRTDGVEDYDVSSLLVSGGTANIPVAVNQFPQLTAEHVDFAESVAEGQVM